MVAIVSYLLLILGELVPKSLGLQYADTLALRVARPIALFARFAGIVVSLLTVSSRAVFSLLRVKGENRTFITREEIQHMVAEGHETGVFSATEQEYIKNIFDFTHTSVREVMVPRTRMVALNLELPQGELVQTVMDNMYSRYPVFRGDIENIIGFVHGKDLLGRLVSEPDFDINEIIRPPHYVPEGKKVNELLKEMQRMKMHIALVVDEYGGISGLVTTEDLLEELVGEIEDEHDAEEPSRLLILPDGSILADALISVYDLERPLDITLSHDLPYDTVAGLILDTLGRFPKKGEKVEWQGYVITCDEVTRTGIVRVRIDRLEQGDTA
jgi:putative hemolysin